MTTTLRPTGPEQHGPDGSRSRGYEICVNSRPVGSTALTTDSRYGPTVGRIQDLRTAVPDRRRGRGTVAALAAEEVLRGWGCTRIEISVPATAEAALRMADGLGYTERNRIMHKPVPALPPALPEGGAGRPMDDITFAAWLEASQETYARSWTERGVPAEQARAKSEEDHRRWLPAGANTPGAVLRVLSHRGTDVGTLWLSLGEGLPDGVDSYVFDVEVAEERRGRGHGRTLMLLAERESRAAGAERLGLNVFVSNTPALRLYESLGYEPVVHALYKPLA